MATPALPPPIKTIHAYVDDYTQAPDPPTVLSFSSYLEDQTKHFWNTSVAWEAYQRGMMISETDVNSIKKLDSLLRKQDSKALCDHFEVYLQTLYRLLQSLNKDDTLQYLLALTNLLIQDYPTVVSKFHDFSKVDAELPYTLFTKLLTKENDFISTVATKILTFLVCSSPTEVSFDLSPLYVAFMSQLSNSNPQIVDVTIQAIQSFLSVVSLRMKFYSFKSGKLNSRCVSNYLVDVLRESIWFQQ
ncbi:H(+)-transporting V1 sector ATPase subunit H [Coelomomyces lativittatus]|nr:H(+)-transporting V1 sector ATPase subunit H [Coelomomyces lativittatus]